MTSSPLRVSALGKRFDGTTALETVPAGTRVGDLLPAVVVAARGVDLVARPIGAQR